MSEQRERYVRQQKDAMGHAIEAHKRGDKKGFMEATAAVEKAGRAMGVKTSDSDAKPLGQHRLQ